MNPSTLKALKITAAAMLVIISTQLSISFAVSEQERIAKTQTYSYFLSPQTRLDVVVQFTDQEKSVSAFLIDPRLAPLRLSEQDRQISNPHSLSLFSFGIGRGDLPHLTLPTPDAINPPGARPDFVSFDEAELNRLLRQDGVFALRRAAWFYFSPQITLVPIPASIASSHAMMFRVNDPPLNSEFSHRRYSVRFIHGNIQKPQLEDRLFVAIADVREDGRFKSGGTASYPIDNTDGTLVNTKWVNVAELGRAWTYAETGAQILVDGLPNDLLKGTAAIRTPPPLALQEGTLAAESIVPPDADIQLANRIIGIQTTLSPVTIDDNGRTRQWRRDLGHSCNDLFQNGVDLYKLFGIDRK